MRGDRSRRFDCRYASHSRCFAKGFINHIFVFLWFERASGVHQTANWSELMERRYEQPHLQVMKFAQLLWLEPPTNFGMACKSSRAGARSIDQDAVELNTEGQIRGCIQFNQPNV